MAVLLKKEIVLKSLVHFATEQTHFAKLQLFHWIISLPRNSLRESFRYQEKLSKIIQTLSKTVFVAKPTDEKQSYSITNHGSTTKTPKTTLELDQNERKSAKITKTIQNIKNHPQIFETTTPRMKPWLLIPIVMIQNNIKSYGMMYMDRLSLKKCRERKLVRERDGALREKVK